MRKTEKIKENTLLNTYCQVSGNRTPVWNHIQYAYDVGKAS